MIENLLTIKDYDKNIVSKKIFKDKNFLRRHWLLRYEILYLDKTNDKFNHMVDDYYSTHSNEIKNMSFKYFKETYQGKNVEISRFYYNFCFMDF